MNDVRSATVTFLFSDIEGSTRLLKQLRDRYGQALEEHDRILREAFAAQGGREIDTQGDAFFIAFDRARDAILAAASAQRELAVHEWPAGATLRVRIGVHTGEAAVAGERYLGLAVHRAARICAAGHGGQVLISQTTQNLIEDEEEQLPGLALRDLGQQRLKDLDRPVRLYQLTGPGLSDSFPPIRTADTPFAGREAELAEAAEASVVRRRLPKSRRALLAATVFACIVLAALVIAATDMTGSGGAALVPPNSVAVIDPSAGQVVAHVGVGAQPPITEGPGTIATGRTIAIGDGSVWVANPNDQTISRIDPHSRKLETIGGINGDIEDLAVASDGAVWATLGSDGLARVARSGSVEPVSLPNPSGPAFSFAGIVPGPGGLWIGRSELGELSVAKFDPATDQVVRTVTVGQDGGRSLALGGGYVWVTDRADSTLTRLDALTSKSIGSPARIASAGSVAVGAGKVWVTDEIDGQLWWDDTKFAQPPGTTAVGPKPVSVAYGAGSVWVADYGDGTVSRVDPNTQSVVKTIKVGAHVSALAVGAGRVWVVVPPGP
jgi:YVTN family beta-propeller protein